MIRNMKLHFYKYDGAGNDFVLLDIRDGDPQLTTEQIAHLCHRRFGIGADGLMTLQQADGRYDFEMKYYNSDGRIGSMCGNGGRCITAFANRLGLGRVDAESGRKCFDFVGFDGPHKAEILMWNDEHNLGIVKLGMRDVEKKDVKKCDEGWFLDTGSPH